MKHAEADKAAMTVGGVQAYLSISRATVYRLVAAGRLRPVKIGRRTLIRRCEADALLGPPSPAAYDIFG